METQSVPVDNPLVVVVDDDPVVRMLALDTLGKDGFRAEEAVDGEAALSLIDRCSPDMVLLDVMMPRMDGFETCSSIRKMPNGPNLPVLMMTGLNDVQSINRAYEAGATDFITKPINWILLRNRVKYMLRASKMFDMYCRTQERNRAIIQALPDMVMILDRHGRMLELKCHHDENAFYPADAMRGRGIRDVLPAELGPACMEHIHAALDMAGIRMMEYAVSTEQGQRFFETRFTRIGPDEVLAVVRDITQRRQDDEKLRHYSEDLEMLVAERTAELSGAVKRLEDEVAQRRRISDELAMLDAAVRTTGTGITISDSDRRIIYVNPADARMHGYEPDELIGKSVQIFAPAGLKKPLSLAEYAVEGSWDHESVNVRKDGTLFPVKLVSDIVRDSEGGMLGIVTTCEDITRQKKAEEDLRRYHERLEELVKDRTNDLREVVGKLEVEVEERKSKENEIKYLAYYDSLTGLPNRTYLNEQIYYALKNADANGSNVALMYIDLDNFKRINDTLGHSMGDVLLKSVSKRLTGCLRRTDSVVMPHCNDTDALVSRLGGDEFIVLIPELSNVDNAIGVAQRILESMSSPFDLGCHEVFVSPSIGITYYPQHGTDADSLLMRADTAMYHAKEQGKNGYMVYTDVMSQTAMARLVIENDLHKAIQRNELSLCYQPLFDISSGRALSLEALLRWDHAKYGNIAPSDFIPIAEQCGLIMPIGDWVLKSVFEQIRKWTGQGIEPLPVAVNLSTQQFIQHNIVNVIRHLFDKYQINPDYLEVEITESSIMKNPAETIKRLKMLKSMGVKISIDDFGTGYSSLSYLRSLPLDAIKVDRSFVQEISDNADSEAITKAIIAMGHSMNLTVVAEGVETEGQLYFLRSHKCDIAQGFYYSLPLSVTDTTALLAENSRKCA